MHKKNKKTKVENLNIASASMFICFFITLVRTEDRLYSLLHRRLETS